MKIPVKYLDHYNKPAWGALAYARPGDSGFDLRAAIEQPVTIEPGRVALIRSGVSVAVPLGFELQVRSRSGLALKSHIFVLNAPGTVDSSYRGEVGTILANFGTLPFVVQPGDRVSQGVIAAVSYVELDDVGRRELPTSERGEGGFGSTGTA